MSTIDLMRVVEDCRRLPCPLCGATCTREARVGTPSLRRIHVECSDPLCGFQQLVEIPLDGGDPRLAAPPQFDAQPDPEPFSIGPRRRSPCVGQCGRVAAEGGFCEACRVAWRNAGRPEPRDAWAQQRAEQTRSERARQCAPPKPSPPAAPLPKAAPHNPPGAEVSMTSSSQLYDSLTRSEKMTLAFYKRAHPGVTIEQWIAAGKPRAGKPKPADAKLTTTRQAKRPTATSPDAATLPKLTPAQAAAPRQASLTLRETRSVDVAHARVRVVMVDAEMTNEGMQQILDQIGRMFTGGGKAA